MSLRGYPDWGLPTRVGTVPGWAAHEEPGVLLLPYAVARSAAVSPGADVTVDAFDLDGGGDAGIRSFGLVTVGFTLEALPVQEVQGQPLPRPAPVGRGFVRLTAPHDLGLAPELLAPAEFSPASARTLTTTLRLGGTETEILVAAFQRDLRALGAVAWVEMPGVAQRVPGSLTVDAQRFSEEAHARWPGGVVTRADLGAHVADGPAGVTTSTPDVPDAEGAARLADAVVDRLLGRLGRFTPPADDAADGAWLLARVEAPLTATWRLDEPLLAPRSVRVATDPVIDSTGASRPTLDVRRHAASGLSDGRHRISLRSTVPASPAGILDVSVDLRAAPAPPHRPFPVLASVRLSDIWRSPTRAAEVELALGPDDALDGTVRVTSLVQTASGLAPIEGPTRATGDDVTPVITPADLRMTFLPVQATTSLLAAAEVTVRLTAALHDAAYVASARLTPDTSLAHLALPDDATDAALVAVAVAADGRSSAETALPVAGVLLDLFTFIDPPWANGPGAPPPTEPTMTQLEIDGLRLTRVDDTTWRFAPLTAGVARGVDGRPQLAVLPTGSTSTGEETGHLSVTTTLLSSDAQQAQASEALVRETGSGDAVPSLEPADVRATAVVLERGDGEGSWTTLATGQPSGTFLQECSFSVPLDAAAMDAVTRAVGGRADLVRVRYELESPPAGSSDATSSSSTSATSTTTVTTTRSSSSGGATSTTTHHDEHATTAATSAAPHPTDPTTPDPTTWTVVTDAAAWAAGP